MTVLAWKLDESKTTQRDCGRWSGLLKTLAKLRRGQQRLPYSCQHVFMFFTLEFVIRINASSAEHERSMKRGALSCLGAAEQHRAVSMSQQLARQVIEVCRRRSELFRLSCAGISRHDMTCYEIVGWVYGVGSVRSRATHGRDEDHKIHKHPRSLPLSTSSPTVSHIPPT